MELSTGRLRTALEGSRVFTTLNEAMHSSRVIKGTRKTVDQAQTIDVARGLAEDIGSWIRNSWAGHTLIEFVDPIEQHYDRSSVRSALDTGVDWIKTSSGYRWLTTEPEPNVIVIDFRDTVSVGPLIASLDATLEFLLPAAGYSSLVRTSRRVINRFRAAPIRAASFGVLGATALFLMLTALVADSSELVLTAGIGVMLIAALGTRIRVSWSELLETRVVQVIVALFEPPTPPEASEGNEEPDSSIATYKQSPETETESDG